jgi:hypothetical protein
MICAERRYYRILPRERKKRKKKKKEAEEKNEGKRNPSRQCTAGWTHAACVSV